MCYNFTMSEVNKGSHPSKQENNLGGIRYEGEGGRLPAMRRRGLSGKGMTGEGLMDELLPQQPVEEVKVPVNLGETQLLPRELKFKANTKLYKVVRDSNGKIKIPWTPKEEEDLFDRRLKVPTTLRVPVDFLETGKRGGTIIKKVGQSDYGAFTVVLFPVQDRDGKSFMEERLVSFLTRSSKKQL